MSKTISNAALGLYAGLVGMFVLIPDGPGLVRDLEDDPFIDCALQVAARKLYHRYGTWLAPLTATLITKKHMRFEHCCPSNSSYNDVGDAMIGRIDPPGRQAKPPGRQPDAASQQAPEVVKLAEPVTERVTKPKDPKKVAAGRTGTAARKAKQVG